MADAAHEIIENLSRPQASIPPKYFYDETGSRLFEQITRLPEYYPTRTEQSIMVQRAAEIARRVGPGRIVIEPGAGNCEKARFLCRAIAASRYVAVDISAEFLAEAAQRLRDELPQLQVQAVAGDITRAIELPEDLPRAHRLVYYPGSSIGNFDRPQALEVLSRMRGLVERDGALLIGVDLRKETSVLEPAYDDAAGVTAAFNLNALAHVNRLVGADFDLHEWRHRAFFNPEASRIEMHLEACTDCEVHWPGGGRRFAPGERIHTENSYKYDVESFANLLHSAGFHHSVAWTDERRWYAVVLATP